MKEGHGEFENKYSFEEQFDRQETLDFYGGEIKVVDITPEQLKDEVPVLIAPGWSVTPKTSKEGIRELTDEGRRTITLEHPNKGEPDLESDEYPKAELRKALALLEVIDKKDLAQVDAIAHSEGALNLCIAAVMHPEKFRNIVLVGPAGMMGPDNPSKLTIRFNHYLIDHVISAFKKRNKEPEIASRHWQAFAEAITYMAKDPKHAIPETTAIGTEDIHKLVKTLHENNIGISIIHGADDMVFPMGKMQGHVKADEVDGFYSVKGNHSELLVHPEQYMALASQALDDLKKKRQDK